jgi:hypothetical protein
MMARWSGVIMIATLAVAGCGGGEDGGSTDIEPTIVFADRSDAEIARLINAAGGGEMFAGMNVVGGFVYGSVDSACPTVVREAYDATITGGCTQVNGTVIQGSATLHDTQRAHYDMQALAITQGGATVIYHGVADRIGRDTETSSDETYDGDVTVDAMGAQLRSDIYYRTEWNETAADITDSGIELIGVGGATVSGHIERGTEDYTLTGVDTVTAHIEDDCVAWSIAGTGRGATCP